MVGNLSKHRCRPAARLCRGGRNRQRHPCGAPPEPHAGRRQPAAQAARGAVRRRAVRPQQSDAATTAAGERLLAHAQTMMTMNDAVWGLMSKPHYEGEVRVGVPHDVVVPNIPPVLRAVRSRLAARARDAHVRHHGRSPRCARRAASSTSPWRPSATSPRMPSCCCATRWSGSARAPAQAHLRDPLPVSFGSPNCAFRASAIAALAAKGRDWRPMCEASALDALKATLYADIAVAPMLLSAVPRRPDGAGSRGRLATAAALLHQHASAPRRPLGGARRIRLFVRQEFASRYGERRQAASAAAEQRVLERS